MYRPSFYTKFNSVQRRDAEDFSEKYSEEISSMSGRCIDIGCGPGDVTVDFILPKLKPNSTVTCADISETMLNYAKKNYGNDDRLSFVKLDIGSLDLPEDQVGQFDHVTSLYRINWCLDLRQAFGNIHKLLRPEGTAFVTFIASCPIVDVFKVLQADPKYQTYMKEVYRIIPQLQHVERPRRSVTTLIKSAGFEVRSCSCRAMSYAFDTVDDLKNFLLALSPRETEQMSTDLYGEYVRDLMREALERVFVFNKNRNGKNECKILIRYRVFVTYLKKNL